MATKSDLIEAQNFSRRRLLTAFVSGAPGGKELEPASPLRAVIAAIALTLAVVLVGVFYGLIKPGLPGDWQNGKLIVVKDTGARFVSVDGTLHPVINTASARLLLPSSGFSIVATDQSSLAGIAIGSTLGILGAPDSLPAPNALLNTGWSACVAPDNGLDVRIGGDVPSASDNAIVVSVDGKLYVIAGGRSFAVDASASDAILRAAGIATLAPVTAPASWLTLFEPGTPLAPISVSNTGQSVAGTTLRIGDVVHIGGDADDERYLVQSDGTLAELSPLAWQLYQLGSGRDLSGVTDVTSAQTSALPTATAPVGGPDWPGAGFTAATTGDRPCALVVEGATAPETVLATVPASTRLATGVQVLADHGALVRAGGRGDQSSGVLTLVDATGTAYPLPGATDETVARLGYGVDDVDEIGSGWIALLHTGPALTEKAAGLSPSGEDTSASSPGTP